ncbi:16S rRNA (cytosine(967)-C(5))-methyltransferase RsmB [Ruminococcus sp. OA3]|uniref:16S rRNA (cytosine(967)-C(5))-methyltransferase RsmB n=1 Tax=Ruminococcus sp. OA3 TaxID=2914164 RepID=UPI001F0655D0|nr:16S rRNA (cytosine(967)-C(5))-methyltransferase RsmB [Ruminococcus sp. OA3]MCH1982284.1 16S rRNA (cytosine(967)-C(5))-methyltransferase RsmB [Ruminococcus sp. OA3]
MASVISTREIILGVLLEINRDGEYSHIAIRNALDKYQYLPKHDRAFITRVCEGTIEYMLRIDYIIEQFSSVKVEKMKPVIREIVRSGVYQLIYMDRIPDSAVCNEAVKLAQKKGFYSLKGFVNGVMRNVARNKENITYPPVTQPIAYLSVKYSMPAWLVEKWVLEFGFEQTERMAADFMEDKPTTIRCVQYMINTEVTIQRLKEQGVTVEKAPYLGYAYYISDYNYLSMLNVFKMGCIMVQDLSSMLVAEVAAPKKNDYVIDLCAAPGGKSLHMADKMMGYGSVEARDLTDYKVGMIEENIQRMNAINVHAVCQDATVFDRDSIEKADIVLADVPCSGYGVIGKKTDIKYKVTAQKQEDLIILQRKILHNASSYVKVGGTLVYSTCTIGREENENNIAWFVKNYPYELESLNPFLPEELHGETTPKGYLQLLPGVHKTDGFFIARMKRTGK